MFEHVSKMASKSDPNKISISSRRLLRLEKIPYVRISMSKILRKTRYDCISDPIGPLKASNYQL